MRYKDEVRTIAIFFSVQLLSFNHLKVKIDWENLYIGVNFCSICFVLSLRNKVNVPSVCRNGN